MEDNACVARSVVLDQSSTLKVAPDKGPHLPLLQNFMEIRENTIM